MGRQIMKPLQALVIEVGGVPSNQLLSQEDGGCRLLFVLCFLLMLDNTIFVCVMGNS